MWRNSDACLDAYTNVKNIDGQCLRTTFPDLGDSKRKTRPIPGTAVQKYQNRMF